MSEQSKLEFHLGELVHNVGGSMFICRNIDANHVEATNGHVSVECRVIRYGTEVWAY